jgi:hypothetical protein
VPCSTGFRCKIGTSRRGQQSAGNRDERTCLPSMESAQAVERLPWFTVTIPGDPRFASAVRDLAVRIARSRGFEHAAATQMGQTVDRAVRHAIAVAGDAAVGQRIKAGFRAETAFEVMLTCEGTDARSAAALAGQDPQRLWDREAISRVMDRVEVGRNGASSFCRMEKRLPGTHMKEPAASEPEGHLEP